MPPIPAADYLSYCRKVAHEAGQAIMRVFNEEFTVSHKDDQSPVTEADIAANRIITEALRALSPHIPIVAEEDEIWVPAEHDLFWLVDPLDGTRSFVRREKEFTVNIGLIYERKPCLGVIYDPSYDVMYWGDAAQGAWKSTGQSEAEPIRARLAPADGVTVVRSKSHPSQKTMEYLTQLSIKEMIPGSSSIKFCKLAEGSADIYPRFGRTMEWDTAAGHAIVLGAGGTVETADGAPLLYGKPGYENPAFIGYGRRVKGGH